MTEILREQGAVREPDLEVRSLFSRGWRVFKEHMGVMIAVFILYSLLTGGGTLWDQSGWFLDFGQLLMYAIAGPITAGVYMFALRLVRGEEPDLGEMFLGFRTFGRSFGVFVLYSVMMLIGFALLVAPGVYVAVALMPAMFLVLDDDLGVIDTLQKAWAMTEGHRGAVFLVVLAIIGLNILGLAFFIVGIVFTGALSLLVGAAMYDELARSYAG